MIAFLSGLPRTGSTLLSAILHQNPAIHAGGNSGVCQTMWDAQESIERNEQIKATKANVQGDIVGAIPGLYYREVTRPIIVDKCRSWTLPSNMEMIRRYITDDPKVIVLTRPIGEIVDSFDRLFKANEWSGDFRRDLTIPHSEPVMRSLDGVDYARASGSGEFHFVE